MAYPKGTYKCPKYLIPLGLLEASNPYAKERHMTIREYGRQAIFLFNYASERGLNNHRSTRLVLPTSTVPLPNTTSRRPPETTIRRPIQMYLPNEQVELMQRLARRNHGSVNERVVNAYRFANFIAEYVHPGDRLLFEQEGTNGPIDATELFP